TSTLGGVFTRLQHSSLWGIDPRPAGRVRLFVVAGQSNALGRGDSASSPSVATGDGYYWNGTAFSRLADPVGGATTGSAWPAFANQWRSNGGVIPVFRGFAGGDTSVLTNEAPNWNVTGSLYEGLRDGINATVAAFETQTKFTVDGVTLLWCEGELAAELI